MRTRSRAGVGALAVLIAAGTGLWIAHDRSTTPAPSHYVDVARTKTLTYPAFVDEYRGAVAALHWPTGYVAPRDPVTADRTGEFEVGAGEGEAVAHFQCAWGKAFLAERSSDPASAQKALAQWSSVDTMPAWDRAFSDPGTRRTLLDARDKARLGDAGGIAELVKANC